jgi:TRAP-type transport system small permease protein
MSNIAASKLESIFHPIERVVVLFCQAVLWISITVIFFILCANTLMRYLMESSLQWANEMPELLFPWLVMAGVVLAAIHGSHITTTFLLDAVKPKYQRLIKLVGHLAVMVSYSVLFVATWRMLPIVHDERSPILRVPNSVTFACVMVGLGLLAALALMAFARTLTTPALKLAAESASTPVKAPLF